MRVVEPVEPLPSQRSLCVVLLLLPGVHGVEERANLLEMHSTAGDFPKPALFLHPSTFLYNFCFSTLPRLPAKQDLVRLHVSSFVVVMMPGQLLGSNSGALHQKWGMRKEYQGFLFQKLIEITDCFRTIGIQKRCSPDTVRARFTAFRACFRMLYTSKISKTIRIFFSMLSSFEAGKQQDDFGATCPHLSRTKHRCLQNLKESERR